MWDQIQKILEFLLELVTYIPKVVYNQFIMFLPDAIDFIFGLPCCNVIAAFADYVINFSVMFPSEIVWFLQWFQLGMGIKWIICAFIVRFIIRRIPIIG